MKQRIPSFDNFLFEATYDTKGKPTRDKRRPGQMEVVLSKWDDEYTVRTIHGDYKENQFKTDAKTVQDLLKNFKLPKKLQTMYFGEVENTKVVKFYIDDFFWTIVRGYI